jgi:hypothetical protein
MCWRCSLRKESDPVPNLATLLGWAETLIPNIPATDIKRCVFSVMFDEGRGVAGFSVVFNEFFTGPPDTDRLSLRVERQHLEPDDPLAAHELDLFSDDYPSAKEFFAAVRANPHYQFACTYPFDETRIYGHPAAGSTKPKG